MTDSFVFLIHKTNYRFASMSLKLPEVLVFIPLITKALMVSLRIETRNKIIVMGNWIVLDF